MQDNISIECSNCGFVFQNEQLNEPIEKRKPCPECGSQSRTIRLAIKAKAEVLARMKLKARKPTSTRKKRRPNYESDSGKKIGKNGKLVSIERIIDRDSNHYKEVIKDKDGNVIVNKDEKLSEHKKG